MKKSIILITIAVLCMFFICFYRLGDAPLEHWDEGFYGVVVQEMMNRGNIIVLYFNDAVFLEKPPFQIWITALVSVFLGLSEWTIRLPSAIAGVIVVGLISWYSYKKWGWFPTIFTIITLVLNDVFIWRSRTGNLDILSTLFFVLIFFAIQWKHRWRYAVLGILFGLLYLTKLGLVVFPFFIFLLYEFIYEKGTVWERWKEYLFLLGCAAIFPLMWLGIGSSMIGHVFWQRYILGADQNVGTLSYPHIDYLLYTYYALQRHFFFFFIGGVILLFVHIRKGTHFLLGAFSLFLIIVLSCIERKNNWYLVPAMPFWSLTIGYFVYELFRFIGFIEQQLERKMPVLLKINKSIKKRFNVMPSLFVLIVMVLLFLFAGYKSYKTYNVNITPGFRTFSSTAEQYSAFYIKNNSEKDHVVVRLDHLYPAMVYYSQRKVVVAPHGPADYVYALAKKGGVDWFVEKKVI